MDMRAHRVMARIAAYAKLLPFFHLLPHVNADRTVLEMGKKALLVVWMFDVDIVEIPALVNSYRQLRTIHQGAKHLNSIAV